MLMVRECPYLENMHFDVFQGMGHHLCDFLSKCPEKIACVCMHVCVCMCEGERREKEKVNVVNLIFE